LGVSTSKHTNLVVSMKNSFVGMHYYKGHGIGNQEGPASKSQDPKTKAILNKKISEEL
jgi:hypothetical protein